MPTTSASVPEPVRAYLDELDRASAGLPRDQRQDLRARVWAEVAEAAGSDPAPERIDEALRRLGPPSALAGTGGHALRDPLVVHLLGCSLLTFGIGGVAGLVRVWRSPSWPRVDALVATLMVVVAGAVLPMLAPVHPIAGALLGGLGVGSLLAACVLGGRMLMARRRARRARRTSPDADAAPHTPRGGGGTAPSGRCEDSSR
ncbi:hypothetical protein [Pseudonocardia sp. KRD291]|uniref:HAAS signaling domain-containing protein n=1 Tax=Pseudonocardia sp. KRD291 TaxID=2792007 RepID=UPI001C49E92B|nr:hypothetical protein [Pseudonocardia sp. KRD291]MBW0101160.1 hypothetical protein [Pseudonocardia sp. KRD291]